jgi:hypothetical protein
VVTLCLKRPKPNRTNELTQQTDDAAIRPHR